jgi:hypothetical protein
LISGRICRETAGTAWGALAEATGSVVERPDLAVREK